jgi:type I restriction enzyme R subunit
LFVNGLPLAIIELKNPADEEATIWTSFQQLQTYKAELPALFAFNELLVVSDGLDARIGTLTAGREWFKPWRTISGEQVEDVGALQLEVLFKLEFESPSSRKRYGAGLLGSGEMTYHYNPSGMSVRQVASP